MRTCEHSSTLKVHSRHTTPPKGINTTHANPKAALTPFSAHARRPRSRRGSSRPILVESPGRMPPSPTAATTEPVCSSKGGSSCAPCESLDRSHLLSPVEVEAALETDLRMWRATETPSDGDGDGTPSVPGISRKFTALNFQCLCTGSKGMGKAGKPLNYKAAPILPVPLTLNPPLWEGSVYHRVIPSFMLQGGDFTR